MDLHCYVMWRDTVIGRLDIENNTLVKNECYTRDVLKHPCSRSKTAINVLGILQNRVICRSRCTPELMKLRGWTEYNWFKIFCELHGANMNDFNWFKFDSDRRELSWKDVNPRTLKRG